MWPYKHHISTTFIFITLLGCVHSLTPEERQKRADLHLELAWNYLQIERDEISMGEVKKALTFQQEHPQAQHLLAVLLERKGDYAEAEKIFYRAHAIAPDNGRILNDLGRLLCNRDKYASAKTILQRAISLGQTQFLAESHYLQANCYMRQHDHPAAMRSYLHTLQLKPSHQQALYQMCWLSNEVKDFPAAADFIARYLSRYPELPELLWLGSSVAQSRQDQHTASLYQSRLHKHFPGYQGPSIPTLTTE